MTYKGNPIRPFSSWIIVPTLGRLRIQSLDQGEPRPWPSTFRLVQVGVRGAEGTGGAPCPWERTRNSLQMRPGQDTWSVPQQVWGDLPFFLLHSPYSGGHREPQPRRHGAQDHRLRPGPRVAQDYQNERRRDLRLDGPGGYPSLPLLQKQ